MRSPWLEMARMWSTVAGITRAASSNRAPVPTWPGGVAAGGVAFLEAAHYLFDVADVLGGGEIGRIEERVDHQAVQNAHA